MAVPSPAHAGGTGEAEVADRSPEVAVSFVNQAANDCTLGAIADQVDPRPNNVYGGGWVTCPSPRPAFNVTVHLYRDGTLVKAGQDHCGTGTGCSASTGEYTDGMAGQQAWTAKVIVATDFCTCDPKVSSVFWH